MNVLNFNPNFRLNFQLCIFTLILILFGLRQNLLLILFNNIRWTTLHTIPDCGTHSFKLGLIYLPTSSVNKIRLQQGIWSGTPRSFPLHTPRSFWSGGLEWHSTWWSAECKLEWSGKAALRGTSLHITTLQFTKCENIKSLEWAYFI